MDFRVGSGPPVGDLLAPIGAVRKRLCLLAVLYDDMGNKVLDGDMGDTLPDDVCSTALDEDICSTAP